MSRSLWKFPIYKPVHPFNINITQSKIQPIEVTPSSTIQKPNLNSEFEFLFFKNRASFITQSRINHRVHIYNGQRWFSIVVNPERVGHRLGEFSPTRKRPIPKKKKQVKQK